MLVPRSHVDSEVCCTALQSSTHLSCKWPQQFLVHHTELRRQKCNWSNYLAHTGRKCKLNRKLTSGAMVQQNSIKVFFVHHSGTETYCGPSIVHFHLFQFPFQSEFQQLSKLTNDCIISPFVSKTQTEN